MRVCVCVCVVPCGVCLIQSARACVHGVDELSCDSGWVKCALVGAGHVCASVCIVAWLVRCVSLV